jgi:hypothetical protein
VNSLVATLSDCAKAVLARVLELEKEKLHMSNPYKIVEDVKGAIVENVK